MPWGVLGTWNINWNMCSNWNQSLAWKIKKFKTLACCKREVIFMAQCTQITNTIKGWNSSSSLKGHLKLFISASTFQICITVDFVWSLEILPVSETSCKRGGEDCCHKGCFYLAIGAGGKHSTGSHPGLVTHCTPLRSEEVNKRLVVNKKKKVTI